MRAPSCAIRIAPVVMLLPIVLRPMTSVRFAVCQASACVEPVCPSAPSTLVMSMPITIVPTSHSLQVTISPCFCEGGRHA